MSITLALDTVHTIKKYNNTLAKSSQFNAIEVQGGTVNLWATIRDDLNVKTKTQMSTDLTSIQGVYPLNVASKIYLESASGSPVIYANFEII